MLKVGDLVPLSVQISDGNPDLEITVKVINPANAVIFEGVLSHMQQGFYETKQFIMPDFDFVIALYKIQNADEYSNASETFYKCDYEEINRALLDEYAPKYDNYYQGVVVSESQDDFLEGYISGTVETQSS